MASLTHNTPKMSVIHFKFLIALILKILNLMIFGTSKRLFVNTYWFHEKRRPETCTVEFVESRQVTVVQAFFTLFASVIVTFGLIF